MASADRCDRCLATMTRDTFERPLADEVLALRTENDKLRERVRFHAVNIEPYDQDRGDGKTWIGCDECLCAWPEGEPESHARDCIAAPCARKAGEP